MSRPVVGISCYREVAHWRSWEREADVLNVEYGHAVRQAGGVPVLIPLTDPDGAAAVVARLDALIIAGGEDVDPAAYGAVPDPQTDRPHPERDASEFALLDAAAERDLPTLGICRGMQVMAVHAGGTLEQHVPDRVGHTRHAPNPTAFNFIDVTTVGGTRLAELLGDRLSVPCHHHQSVREAPGYRHAASADDETLEGFEIGERRFWLGVQWHPEMDSSANQLFDALLVAAGAPADGRVGSRRSSYEIPRGSTATIERI